MTFLRKGGRVGLKWKRRKGWWRKQRREADNGCGRDCLNRIRRVRKFEGKDIS